MEDEQVPQVPTTVKGGREGGARLCKSTCLPLWVGVDGVKFGSGERRAPLALVRLFLSELADFLCTFGAKHIGSRFLQSGFSILRLGALPCCDIDGLGEEVKSSA